MNPTLLSTIGFSYQQIIKPILFQFDAEKVHHHTVSLGQFLGKFLPASKIPVPLTQKVVGINFPGPIGLAAGFDYEACLIQTLPFLEFGFETVGTITNLSFTGNPYPRLGRLPKSQSLMVNKGFKNLGATVTITKMAPLAFTIPIGVSIGSREAKITDIVSAFTKFEAGNLNHSYYELNISCPNLQTRRDFYSVANLTALLSAIDGLKITRPIFVKMPISKTDTEILRMLEVISRHCPKGVILGNLQKDRAALHPSEILKYSVGNFSGKPTYKRSNELIKIAFQKYRQRFVIIGCGGVFSATDAYEKICLGASLVQLITGLVYQGPQLVAQINLGLVDLLKKDGYTNIHEAIGSR